MKIRFNALIMSLGMLFMVADGKVVEFIENGYAQQAPAYIVAGVEKAATYFDFTLPYEVAVPKKAGLQVNPWNQFMSYGINPQTQNPYIVVNSEWFSKMPADEQLFLLGRAFENFKQGMVPWSVRLAPFGFALFSIGLMVLIYFALGKTRLAQHKKWIRIVIAYGMVAACNLAFMNSLSTKFVSFLAARADNQRIEAIIKRTGNKEAAIKALQNFDDSIKKDLAEGQTYWKPFEHTFENYIKSVKK